MNKILTVLVSVMVAGVIVGASLPIFDSLTASSDSVHNDGAGWVRFDLNTDANASYIITLTGTDDAFIISNGTDTQIYDENNVNDFASIMYADSNLSVWIDDDGARIMGLVDGAPVYGEFSEDVTITRDSEGVTVQIGDLIGDSMTFDAPTWAYVPKSTGSYGFFNASNIDYDLGTGGVKNYPSDMPLAVVGGGFAGVYAYNDIYRYEGLGLEMTPLYDDAGLFYGAYWDLPAVDLEDIQITPLPGVITPGGNDTMGASNPVNPDPIDIDPLNPGDLVLANAPPTPTYTSGDWGYDLVTDDGVQKAVLVKYLGAGGSIVAPATIDGYDVLRVGKSTYGLASRYAVTTNSAISDGSTLVISDGIKQIGGGAFSGCKKLTSLTLSNTLEWIDDEAFYNCTGLTGLLEIPASVKTIGYSVSNTGAFQQCTGLTSLKLNYGIEKIVNAFRGCSNMTGALVIPDSVTNISAIAFGSTGFTGELVIPDSVTTFLYTNFSYMPNITSIKIGSGMVTIPNGCFMGMTGFIGDFIIPSTVKNIGEDTALNGSAFYNFGSTNNTDTLVIPNTIELIGYQAFTQSKFKTVIIASDDEPYDSSTFSSASKITQVLDLSRSVDYSVDRHGIRAEAEVSDNIGDCFGFISVVDVAGSGGGPVSDLIGILPVVIVAGLVLVAVAMLIIRRT